MKSTWTPTTKIVVVAVFLILLGLFIYAVRPLINPLIVASLLAYALYPLVERLENRPRINHTGAVLLVYFPFLILLFATPGTLVPLLVRQIQTLTNEVTLVFNLIEDLLAQPVTILGQTISQEQLAVFLRETTQSFTPAAEDAIMVLEATSTSLVWFIVILVTTYYLLADWNGLRRWFMNIFRPSEQVDLAQLLHGIDLTWRAYLRGTLLLMFMMGIFFTIVGLALGLPGAVALGLLTGLLSMVPEIGPMVAGILASLVAFFEGSSYLPLSNFWFALLIAGIYIVVMQLKSLWIRPFVMGRFMHMHTGLVFVAIIGSALSFGILAALIVLPVLASAGQIGHYVRCKLLDMDPYP